MSKTIRPKQGVVYECYKGFTDIGGDRCRTGQKFVWNGDTKPSDIYVLEKASGRGMEMYVRGEQFASYFIPSAEQDEQTEPKSKFKVGDKVMISDDSSWLSWSEWNNPANTEGTITKIKDCDLGIHVKWSNDEENSYNDHDLVLAEQKSYIDDNQLKQYSMKAIVVSNIEQIKELAKVSFLKDQIESQFPELFITHKVGNRYKHSDGNRYILTGENSSVALTNLKTGRVESSTVRVNNFNKITADEFSELCEDYKELTLIKERQ
jgi:hypothetical protein